MAGPNIPVKPGINSQAVRNIPKDWDPIWFRRFITDHMQNMDFRSALTAGGIVISGTEQQQGTIALGSVIGNLAITPPLPGLINFTSTTIPYIVVTDGTIEMVLGVASGVDGFVGTTSNNAVEIRTNNLSRLVIGADGGVTIGSPAGGDKGIGTLNVQGPLYVNGVAVTVP